MRLLLVEDEPPLARHLARGLREEGYAVDVAGTAGAADDLASSHDYDLVLLDLRLPDRSGLDLLGHWRAQAQNVPVLVLSARDTVDDKVGGLDAGADDYLTKPFAFAELLARLRSLLRRPESPPQSDLRFADLTLSRAVRSAERAGRPLALTTKEFALLEYFMLHPGTALSRAVIAEHVWDVGFEARTNVIDVIVGRLRRKLEADGNGRLIHTLKGFGYALRPSPPSP
jgi:DNA-binding response OmpR family regulator